MKTETKKTAPIPAQHTPGPWMSTVQSVGPILHRVTTQDGERGINKQAICGLLGEGSQISTDETYANARLIASAPDLLAALQQIKTVADFAIASPSHSARYMQDVEILAAAAIAKARA